MFCPDATTSLAGRDSRHHFDGAATATPGLYEDLLGDEHLRASPLFFVDGEDVVAVKRRDDGSLRNRHDIRLGGKHDLAHEGTGPAGRSASLLSVNQRLNGDQPRLGIDPRILAGHLARKGKIGFADADPDLVPKLDL